MIKKKKYLNLKIEQPDGSVVVQQYFQISDYNTEAIKSMDFYEILNGNPQKGKTGIIESLQNALRMQDIKFMYGNYDLRTNTYNKKWKKEIFRNNGNEKA